MCNSLFIVERQITHPCNLINIQLCLFFPSSYFLLSSLPSLPQLCKPLLYGRELVLHDISACWTNFFRLLVVVNNPFTQRKDSYSWSPINGALFNFRFPVTYFEKFGSRFMQKFVLRKLLASFCWMLDSNSGPPWKQFTK